MKPVAQGRTSESVGLAVGAMVDVVVGVVPLLLVVVVAAGAVVKVVVVVVVGGGRGLGEGG